MGEDPQACRLNETTAILLGIAFVAILVLLAMSLVGCNTVEALGGAPPAFWITLESVLLAIGQDIASIVRLVLPI